MGPMITFSDNLMLKVENAGSAKQVLDMYLRNTYAFENYEPTRPYGFYTIEYQAAMLRREYRAYEMGTFLRYYIYLSANPTKVIGSINFNFFHGDTQSFAEIGYKIDSLYQNRGFAFEACTAALRIVKSNYHTERIDARIHPDNTASLKLAARLGMKPVRLEPKSANILGKDVDLIRYSLNTSDIQ